MQVSETPMLSLVVPMFNEAEAIAPFFERVLPIVQGLGESFEIVCVNDGSRDGTVRVLNAWREQCPEVKIVDLSRNFGKEAASSCGLSFASGRAVILIDADLQDPPELIPEMVSKWREGFDMVLAHRRSRDTDSIVKRTTAGWFYRLINRMSDVAIPENTGDFRLMDAAVVDALGLYGERTRFMKGLFASLGFRQAVVEFDREARIAGTSKWAYWKLWNLALEGLTSFSSAPLRIWSYLGFLVAISGLLYAIFVVLKTLIFGVDVPGYASLIVIVLIFSGLQLLSIGIMGEYVARIFIEVKARPLYIVRDAQGFDEGWLRGRSDYFGPSPVSASIERSTEN